MSGTLMIWAAGLKCESAVERSVLWALADMAKVRGGKATCWPSQRKLAEISRCSEKSVQRVLADFEARGWLRRTRRPGRRGTRSSDVIELLSGVLTDSVSGSLTDSVSNPTGLHVRVTYQENLHISERGNGSMAIRELLTALGLNADAAETLMAAYAIRYRKPLSADAVLDLGLNTLDPVGAAGALILKWQTAKGGDRGGIAGQGEATGATAVPVGAIPAPALRGYIAGEPVVSRIIADNPSWFALVLDTWLKQRRTDMRHLLEQKSAWVPVAIIQAVDERARGPP